MDTKFRIIWDKSKGGRICPEANTQCPICDKQGMCMSLLPCEADCEIKGHPEYANTIQVLTEAQLSILMKSIQGALKKYLEDIRKRTREAVKGIDNEV